MIIDCITDLHDHYPKLEVVTCLLLIKLNFDMGEMIMYRNEKQAETRARIGG